jgi:prepilin-type N-terminal cleavage/methylation domain-containing protein
MERRQNRSDSGFTLIELLVVIAIIGLLAAIAIPQYASYKQQSVDKQMESTLQAGRHAMEAYFVKNDTYLAADETVLHDEFGFRRTVSNTLAIGTLEPLRFVIKVCAPGGTSDGLQFDSAIGRSTPISPCP